MRSRRRAIALSILVVALAGWAWSRTDSLIINSMPAEPLAGECYALECAQNTCTLDLDFTASSRYVLVVGSLDPSRRAHHVDFQSQPVAVVSPLSLRRIEPLEIPSHRFGDNSASSQASQSILDSCDTDDSGSPAHSIDSAKTQPMEREFFIHVTDGNPDDPRQYARVVGKRVAESRHVTVYLDSQQTTGELAHRLADEVVWLFDNVVLPTSRKKLGRCRDVDGDGKFTILLSPWLDRLQGGRTSLGGFVREGDFRAELPSPFSNHCDMMCLNSNLRPDTHLCTLLMHEFTHAVCFSERLPSELKRFALPPEEDWLNEAMAHVSENMIGSKWSNLDYRISRFLSSPQDYPLVVDDYFGTGMWRNHGCRGATYLFLRWCVDQYGEGLLPRLVRSPSRGARSLEWATGQPFDELFRRWSIALYESGRVAGEDSTTASSESRIEDAILPKPSDFRTIALCGRLSDYGLAGPLAQQWNVDEAGPGIAIRGTAPAFLELTASGQPGVRHIVVHSDAGSHLQVSLIRLADGWPRLAVQTQWLDSNSSAAEGNVALANFQQQVDAETAKPHGRNHRLMVRVSFDNESDCSVETIACERNYDETKESLCFSGETLDHLRQPTSSPEAGRHSAVYELPIRASLEPGDAPSRQLCVKVLARDAHGRRATAWLTLDEPESAQLEFTAATDETPRR